MIQRNALKYLSEWAKGNDRKPLVLRGARQVGKTTLVNEFSKNYSTYLVINLEKDADRKLFEDFREIHLLLDAIFIHNKQQKRGSDTLLFIDEIQNSPRAVAMLRYFYEEVSWLHVIAAGSLLESLIDKKISFPVGRVGYMALHPCSFTEFLDGIGETFDRDLVENMQIGGVHERLMQLFKTYMLVGGMPAVINVYADKRDVLALDDIYDAIITAYRDDIEKYARNNSQANIMDFILAEGWRYAAETISFQRFGKSDYRSREVGEAFRTLEKALLLELVYPTTSTKIPLLSARARKPKLIWLDTGMVNFVAGIREELFMSQNVNDVWRGRIAEHIVAQELIANETKMTTARRFWVRDKDQSSAEVDFVIAYKGMAVPIEVKSGHNAHLKSLHLFMQNVNHDMAIRVWSQPFSVDEVKTIAKKTFRLINVPFYYVGVIDKILESLD